MPHEVARLQDTPPALAFPFPLAEALPPDPQGLVVAGAEEVDVAEAVGVGVGGLDVLGGGGRTCTLGASRPTGAASPVPEVGQPTGASAGRRRRSSRPGHHPGEVLVGGVLHEGAVRAVVAPLVGRPEAAQAVHPPQVAPLPPRPRLPRPGVRPPPRASTGWCPRRRGSRRRPTGRGGPRGRPAPPAPPGSPAPRSWGSTGSERSRVAAASPTTSGAVAKRQRSWWAARAVSQAR